MLRIRLLGLIAVGLAMTLALDLTTAQETETTCKGCPAKKLTAAKCVGGECFTNKFAGAKCADEKCKEAKCTGNQCKNIEIEVVGFELPFGGLTKVEEIEIKKDSQGKAKREIAIEVTCDCDIPFLSNIPYVNRLFKNVGIDEKRVVRGVPLDFCTGNSDDACCSGKVCCDKAGSGCCSTKQASANKTCGGCVKIPATKCCSKCPGAAEVKLATFVADTDATETGAKFNRQLIELRIENERLQAELEAAERHFEFMEEMCRLREENAELRARLRYTEKQKSPTPPSVTARHIYSVPPTIVHPHASHPLVTPQPLPMVQRGVTVGVSAPRATTHHLADTKQPEFPPLPKAVPKVLPREHKKCGSECNKMAEVAQLVEHVKKLQRELKEAKKKK